jgi:hypothetical protein
LDRPADDGIKMPRNGIVKTKQRKPAEESSFPPLAPRVIAGHPESKLSFLAEVFDSYYRP